MNYNFDIYGWCQSEKNFSFCQHLFVERLKSQLLAMVQSVLKFIQALCTSPSDYVFLEAKNTPRRLTSKFKLIFLNYEK